MSLPAEQRWRGTIASRGLVLGTAVVGGAATIRSRTRGTPDQEWAALTAAVRRTTERLHRLAAAAAADESTVEIVEIQTALLEDEALLEPARQAIAEGAAADHAWSDALQDLIAGYEAEDDDYFRARATDLKDLRDSVLRALTGGEDAPAAAPDQDAAILVAQDLTPTGFLETDWSRFGGAALIGGSATSHVAMLARSRGIPMLVGIDGDLAGIAQGIETVLDAESGWLVLMPAEETRRQFAALAAARAGIAADEARYLAPPAVTADGRRILVQINADSADHIAGVSPDHCDGIGLTRTEFLFHGPTLPDEETQYRAYADLMRWAAGRPVTIRTLDAGGDKPIAGLTPDAEANPFLGMRGVRLSLARPEVFIVQIRALARAAARGPLKVMCPMVTVPAEMARVRTLFTEAVRRLQADGVACAMPQLGMMVEVPAAAIRAQEFPVDFYSIGSNDLVQYVTATARDNPTLAPLHDPRDPAVLELIGRVIVAGAASEREVSVCGDMAADPRLLALLLAMGLTSVSVAPAALARVKAAIARFDG